MLYDLHVHSCLSPCGDNDMTPGNVVGMAALCGLEVVACADHNTCLNCPAVLAHAAEQGILALPAMELTTAEEVHVLCLLPDLPSALSWSAYVYEQLPDVPADPLAFGEQRIMDADEKVIGTLDKLLISATSISIYDVSRLVSGYGGLALPAHVDRSSFSLISNLGFYDPDMAFTAVELTPQAGTDILAPAGLSGLHVVRNSDAHYLEHMRDAEFSLPVRRVSARAVIEYLSSVKEE